MSGNYLVHWARGIVRIAHALTNERLTVDLLFMDPINCLSDVLINRLQEPLTVN